MTSFMSIWLLICLYWLLQAGLRYVGPWILGLLFGVVPLLMLPYWMMNRDFDGFIWLKLYSVFVCVCWGTWFRFSGIDGRCWARRITLGLLAANIAEAVGVDFLAAKHGFIHSINGLAGVLLILQLIQHKPGIRAEQKSKTHDLQFDLPMDWVVGYTLWNWTFVALNYQAYLGHHTAVLVAAMIVAIADRRKWVQARAATLGINLLMMAISPSLLLKCCDTSDWSIEPILDFVPIIAAIWIVAGSLRHSNVARGLIRSGVISKGYLLGSSITPVQFGGATRRF